MLMQQRATRLSQLWHDESASVLTAEVALLATILVLGIVVGAKSLRDAAVTEWADFAQSIGRLDQSYNIPDVYDSSGSTVVLLGGHFLDQLDVDDGPLAPTGNPLTRPGNDISTVPATGEGGF